MASATPTMIDIKIVDGLYIVTASKCTLVLTKAQFIEALRRGKWWRRRQQFQAQHRKPHHGVYATFVQKLSLTYYTPN